MGVLFDSSFPKNAWTVVLTLLITLPVLAGSPVIDSVSPSTGSGSAQTFVLSVSDSDGFQDITAIQLLINTVVDARNACYLTWTKWDGAVHLVRNDGENYDNLPSSNSQCAATGSSSGNGNTRVLTVNVTFSSSFAGSRIVYTGAQDVTGNSTGWPPAAVYTVAGPTGNPSISSLIPNAPNSSATVLSVTANDVRGAGLISAMQILVNSALTGSNACWITWTRWDNNVHLVIDDFGNYIGAPLGTPTPLVNSQCAVSNAVMTQTATSLTLSVSVVAASSFAGRRAIWTAAQSSDGTNSFWQARGIWQLATYSAPSVFCEASPNPAAINQPQVFSASAIGGVGPYTYSWSGAVNGIGPNRTFASGTPGTYGATVTVVDSALQSASGSCSAGIATTGPSFLLTAPAPQSVTAGENTPAGVGATITPLNGFNSQVTFSWANAGTWPTGMQASFTTNPSSNETGIVVQTTSATPPGTYTLLLAASGPGVTQTQVFPVTVRAIPVYPYYDVRLIALDSGDIYGYFGAYTWGADGPAVKSEILNPKLIGPSGTVLWQSSNVASSMGATPAFSQSNSFFMPSTGFGKYRFQATFRYTYTKATNVIPSETNVDMARDYPLPVLSSLSATSAFPGSAINGLQLRGAGLGATDLAWSLMKGVSSINISGTGIDATLLEQPAGQDYVGNELRADLAVGSTALAGTRQISATVYGYTTNSLPFVVGDLEPIVDGVQQLGALPPGGDAYISIYGSNFGNTPGSVAVCAVDAVPCASQDVQVLSIQYWSNTQINALLRASPSAIGYYDVAVNSSGAAGSGFVQVPGRTTGQSPAPRKKIAVSNSTDLSLQVTSNGQTLSPGQCIWIDENAVMPPLIMKVVSNSGAPVSGTATWRVMVTFNQSLGANGTRVLSVNTPDSGPTPPMLASNEWSAPFTSVHGGEGNILWTYNGVAQQPFAFCIRGRNPSPEAAISYLNTSTWWMARNISIHETNASNFCQADSRTNGAPYCLNGANPGKPIFGAPAGYGMGQLDTPTPTMTQIWNWKANVDGMSALLSAKAAPNVTTILINGTDPRAYVFWRRQLAQFARDDNGRPSGSPQVPAPPDQQESPNCLFRATPQPIMGTANNYWFADAILLKQMAGAKKQYLSWIEARSGPPYVPGRWEFNKETYRPDGSLIDANIVWEFCTCTTLASCQR